MTSVSFCVLNWNYYWFVYSVFLTNLLHLSGKIWKSILSFFCHRPRHFELWLMTSVNPVNSQSIQEVHDYNALIWAPSLFQPYAGRHLHRLTIFLASLEGFRFLISKWEILITTPGRRGKKTPPDRKHTWIMNNKKSSRRSYGWIFNLFAELVSNKTDCDLSHCIAYTGLWICWYHRYLFALKCLLPFITLCSLECLYHFRTIKTVSLNDKFT